MRIVCHTHKSVVYSLVIISRFSLINFCHILSCQDPGESGSTDTTSDPVAGPKKNTPSPAPKPRPKPRPAKRASAGDVLDSSSAPTLEEQETNGSLV